MPTFTRDGAIVAYRDTGAPDADPDAPTVVFGHGLLFSGRMFDAQIAALRTRYRCVSVDWRGQGDSPAAAGGYGMDSLAEDAVALIEHLGTTPVHWVGLSMGGFVGMRVAARQPGLIRSLTLLDTSAERETRLNLVQDLALAGVYRVAGIAPVRGQVERVMFGSTFRRSPHFRRVSDDWVTGLRRSARSAISSAVVGVVTRSAVTDELARIVAPTLVATGAHDVPTPPERGRRIAAAIPGARFELIAGAGHSSTVEQPAAVTALLRDFVVAH